MKKIVFGILALFVVAGSVSAVPSVDDRRAMCEKTDGYVWVPKTKACIPVNPCKSDNFTIKDAYCVDIFDEVQTHGDLYLGLVELYARAHKLQCAPVEQKAKLVGQDYVMCMGDDVRVFEFDDIQDSNSTKSSDFFVNLATGLCEAVGGYFDSDDNLCKDVLVEECDMINETIQKYPAELTGRGDGFAEYHLTHARYVPDVAACLLVNKTAPDESVLPAQD